MPQITARRRFSRLAASAALLIASLFSLDEPLQAQATLVVSDYGTSLLSFFNATPSPTATSGTFPFGGNGFEGNACLADGAAYQIFVAANSDSIYIYNMTLPSGAGSFNGFPFATVAGASFTGLALSPDGKTLYAADYIDATHGFIYAFSTATSSAPPPIFRSLQWGAHDVAVDTSGNVYTTDFKQPLQGVTKLGKNLTIGSIMYNFILKPVGASGLAGMAFDSHGNLWVSDFGAVGTNRPGAYEFLKSGFVLGASVTSSLFYNPLGLALNPADGNIYVANFSAGQNTNPGENSVLEIYTTTTPPLTWA